MKKELVRKIIIYLGLFLIGFIIGYLIANIPKLRYDLDNDGKITVKDMIVLRNYYLEN
jgi:hypothetical protein